MKNWTLYFVLISFIIACTPPSSTQFTITGEISGIQDGETVYLYDRQSRLDIDSALVTDGKFEFTGAIDEIAMYYLVYRDEENQRKYRTLWLENININIKGDLENFTKLDVAGSEVQKQEDEYFTLVADIHKKMDSIDAVYDPADGPTAKLLAEEYSSLTDQETEKKVEFVKKHPDYYYSAYLIKRLVRLVSPEEGSAMYEQLSDEFKEIPYAKDAKTYLDTNKDLQIGDRYVDVTLPNQQGVDITLSSFEGKYILIDFWASWCNPCRRENPNLLEAFQKFNEKGFEIYAISLDKNTDDWKKAIKEDGIVWTTVNDPGGFDCPAAMTYSVKFIPHNMLISPEGEILAIDLRGEELLEKLTDIFG